MTYTDVLEELERQPFRPLRLHFVSGKTIDIRNDGVVWPLRRAFMILQEDRDRRRSGLYDVIAPRNIERIEHLPL